MTTLNDLADRLFADVPEVASIMSRDPRTVRAAAEAGQIPSTKVGKKYLIPTSWLREQMSQPSPAPVAQMPDLDDLADQVADRLFARFAHVFSAMLGGSEEAA